MEMKTIWDKVQKLYKILVNRETIAYAIVGGLTTLVNFISYYMLCNILGVPNLIANAIAWVLAVSFAYITNDKFVFLSIKSDVKNEAIKITKFFGARVVTFVIEEAGLYLFVDLLGFYNLIVKAALAVIVIILNYIFSKLYIFKS